MIYWLTLTHFLGRARKFLDVWHGNLENDFSANRQDWVNNLQDLYRQKTKKLGKKKSKVYEVRTVLCIVNVILGIMRKSTKPLPACIWSYIIPVEFLLTSPCRGFDLPLISIHIKYLRLNDLTVTLLWTFYVIYCTRYASILHTLCRNYEKLNWKVFD